MTQERRCYDCKFLKAYVTCWCTNKEAIEARGTKIPGICNCPYWEEDVEFAGKGNKTKDNTILLLLARLWCMTPCCYSCRQHDCTTDRKGPPTTDIFFIMIGNWYWEVIKTAKLSHLDPEMWALPKSWLKRMGKIK